MPVSTVATVSDGPGDEGTPRHRWPEDDGGENNAGLERLVANTNQSVRESGGGDPTASSERTFAETF